MKEKIIIEISSLEDLINLGYAYREGEIKLNISKIANDLGKDRKTVRRYLNGKVPKKTRKRKKYLDDYRTYIIYYLKDENREFEYLDHLYYFMVREHNIKCARTTFYRYITNDEELSKAFKTNKDNIFTVRFETEPGQQAQFDLKEKVKLIDESGNTYVVYIPTLTLSWSRYNYREIILNNNTENLLLFLAKAFEMMGGVPKELVIDNLTPFIEKARSNHNDTAILNPKFEEFCKNYGIIPRPCMPSRPQTKGKIETQNKIVDQLKNYNGHYKGILDIHDKLRIINEEDNNHISQATRLPRIFLFQKEKGALLPLPSKEIRSKYHLSYREVIVGPDSLFQYKYNKYSLPKKFIGKRVGLVIQGNKLLVYYNDLIVERHEISNSKLNIKQEHHLTYDYYEKLNEVDKERIQILKELENIIYDNG